MKTAAITVVLNLFLVLVIGCGEAPKVVQGTVIDYKTESMTVLVKDDLQPDKVYAISIQNSEFGLEPVVGDVVRISYRDKDGKLSAIRIMNLSHIEDQAKKG